MEEIWKKYNRIIGLAVIAAVLAILYAMGEVSLRNAAVMGITALAVCAADKIKSGKLQGLKQLLYLFLVILFSFTLLNSFVGFENILHLCKEVILDAVLFGTVYLLIAGITGNIKITVWAGSVLSVIYLVLNIFLINVRGRKLNYFDISSIGTALNVAGQYRLTVTAAMLLSALLLLFFAWWCSRGLTGQQKGGKVYLARGAAVLSFAAVFGIFIGTGVLKTIGIYDRAWDYDEESLLLNFIVEYKEVSTTEEKAAKIPCPEGYSEEKALSILRSCQDELSGETAENIVPNIIVIMNESFADLRIYGSLGEADGLVMPFYDSLQENTLKGTAYSSVFGGNTANSEYEFLTGDSMIFYPKGSVTFSFYLKDFETIPSVVNMYRQLGYETYGMHPYRETGWYRDRIYPALGFENIFFESDFSHENTIRSFVSDKENYKKIIEAYENKESDRLFVFNVTMQNHGGYSGNSWKGEISEELLSEEVKKKGNQEELELYLSLMRESDKALEELIAYFQTADEPVAVLLFGDHQPGIEYTMKQEASIQQYAVPFCIWTNFPTEAGQTEAVSINYLPVLLAERTGTPMNAYFRFLQDMYAEYPVITAEGIIDSQGEYRKGTDETVQEDILNYEYVMYYRMTGSGEEYNRLFGYGD